MFENVLSDKKEKKLKEVSVPYGLCKFQTHTHTRYTATVKYFKSLSFQKPQARTTNRNNRQILKLKENLAS